MSSLNLNQDLSLTGGVHGPGISNMGSSIPSLSHSNLMVLANNLRTGNLILDMCLMTFLSSLIGMFMGALRWENIQYLWSLLVLLYQKIFKKKKKAPAKPSQPVYQVIINYEYLKSDNGRTKESNNTYIIENKTIFDALFHYLSKQSENMQTGEFAMNFARCFDYDWQRYRDYELKIKPLSQIKIQDFTIDFSEQIHKPDEQKKEKEGEEKEKERPVFTTNQQQQPVNVTYHKQVIISSKLKKIPEILDFITEIYTEYVNLKYPRPTYKERIEPKYYYVRTNDNDYKRYNLTSKVTFDHIFFPYKDKLLRQITKFLRGEVTLSKYTILLHGPPGGGKTSFIKALHNLTGNHVIVVKLSQFKSIKDLINAFHEENLFLSSGNYQKIPIDKRIYLFEDIDAEDEIVLKRDDEDESDEEKDSDDKKKQDSGNSKSKKSLPPSKKCLIESEESSTDEYDEYDECSSEPEPPKPTKKHKKSSSSSSSPVHKYSKFNRGGPPCARGGPGKGKKGGLNVRNDFNDFWGEFGTAGKFNKYYGGGVGGGAMGGAGYYSHTYPPYDDYKKPPSLKLADILNLLDGVLELSGCFVVLTTNFKHKLDSALVRPGRITFDLALTYIRKPQMKEMLNKFIPNYWEQAKEFTSEIETEIIDKMNEDPKLKKDIEDGNVATDSSEAEEPGQCLLEWLLDEVEKRNDCMPCRFETFCQNEEKVSDVMKHIVDYLKTPVKEPEAEFS